MAAGLKLLGTKLDDFRRAFCAHASQTIDPSILAPDGLVVVETDTRVEPVLPPLAVRTSRRYGAARLSLFERAP